jgi:hypothetical protein
VETDFADGFEAAERPANVPEDAMLEADLELVAWRSVEDVTPDGGVVKKVCGSRMRLRSASACTGQLVAFIMFSWPQPQLSSWLRPACR